MNYEIPANPGLEQLPKDDRDILYSAVFGVEKTIPRKFRRPLPIDLKTPYQKRVPSCVSCCETFINQYKRGDMARYFRYPACNIWQKGNQAS